MPSIRKIEPFECEALYVQMMEDFPPEELIPFSNVKNNIEKGIFDAMYLTENGVILGYCILTALDGMDYVIGNYLAVDNSFRDMGIGRDFLLRVIEKYAGKILVIEVENPRAATTEADRRIREKRFRFYIDTGFHVVPTQKADILGVDMVIMANTDKKITNVREIINTIYARSLEPQLLEHIDVVDVEEA